MFYKEIQEKARPGSAFLEHLQAQGLKKKCLSYAYLITYFNIVSANSLLLTWNSCFVDAKLTYLENDCWTFG